MSTKWNFISSFWETVDLGYNSCLFHLLIFLGRPVIQILIVFDLLMNYLFLSGREIKFGYREQSNSFVSEYFLSVCR